MLVEPLAHPLEIALIERVRTSVEATGREPFTP
jgi:hypothetical protein